MHVTDCLYLEDLPAECIEDCSMPGRDATATVRYWIERLNFTVDAARARACLWGYGAWDGSQLADDSANAERIFWLACGEFGEFMQGCARAGINPHKRPDGFSASAGSDIFVLE